MGEGQETSERPASFHEHRAVWSTLNGLIKSPSNPSFKIIMYNILDIQTSRNNKYQSRKKKDKKAFIHITGHFKLPILCWITSFIVSSDDCLRDSRCNYKWKKIPFLSILRDIAYIQHLYKRWSFSENILTFCDPMAEMFRVKATDIPSLILFNIRDEFCRTFW